MYVWVCGSHRLALATIYTLSKLSSKLHLQIGFKPDILLRLLSVVQTLP